MAVHIGYMYIQNTRFINFATCLDYLPKSSKTKIEFHCLFSDSFENLIMVNSFLITIVDNIELVIFRIFVESLKFTFKLYIQSLLIFFCIYNVFFCRFKPCIQICSLWFINLILLSMDIEENPGPARNQPIMGFNNSFFSFCNWNLNTLK